MVLSQVDEEPLCGCSTSKSLYVVLFYFLYITVGHVLVKKKTNKQTNKQQQKQQQKNTDGKQTFI